MINVLKYSPEYELQWNTFLNEAKNATFLFRRSYMDYHKERFEDFSLMVFHENELVALLPGNLQEDRKTIISHGGLSYGGLIVKRNSKSTETIKYFYQLLEFLNQNKIETLLYKAMPSFYFLTPGDEIDYALFLLKAELYRVDMASVVDLRAMHRIPYQERRIRSIKKAQKNEIIIKSDVEFPRFWNEILVPNLKARYDVKPVHTAEEMQKLYSANNEYIHLYTTWKSDQLMAGTVIFETATVAHAQYISASEEGKKNGAIDLLFNHLINEVYTEKHFFDFGIVNEQNGMYLNKGLLEWKEGFGARTFAHKFYKVQIANRQILNDILIAS